MAAEYVVISVAARIPEGMSRRKVLETLEYGDSLVGDATEKLKELGFSEFDTRSDIDSRREPRKAAVAPSAPTTEPTVGTTELTPEVAAEHGGDAPVGDTAVPAHKERRTRAAA